MTAEMEARRTAAAAVLADYERALDAFDTAGVPMPWATWAVTLAAHSRLLLEQLAAEPVTLADLGQRAILRQALTDAIAYRDPVGTCPDCDPGFGLCDDHSEDADRTEAYLALARELALGVER